MHVNKYEDMGMFAQSSVQYMYINVCVQILLKDLHPHHPALQACVYSHMQVTVLQV